MAGKSLFQGLRLLTQRIVVRPGAIGSSVRHHSSIFLVAGPEDPACDLKYKNFFLRPDIDGWEVRKAMTDLHGMDMVPEPSVIIAALGACRRINEYSLAIRYLESVRFKCICHMKTIWPYIVEEIKPTCTELGIELPEEIGYHVPELYCPSVFEPMYTEPEEE